MKHIDSFITYLEREKNYSPHTIVAYTKDLVEFERYCVNKFRKFTPEEITGKQLREYFASVNERGIQKTTLARKITSLKSFYKYLHRYHYVAINKMDHVQVPKLPKRVIKFIPSELIHKLLDEDYFPDTFKGARDRFMIALLYYTGMRSSEVVDLKLNNYNVKKCEVKVYGKRKERIIPFNESLNVYFVDYFNKRKEIAIEYPEFMFLTENGKRIYWKIVYDVVNFYVSKVFKGFKNGAHILRHSYATTLINNGANIVAIKELLGHSSLQATTIYTHVDIDRIKSVHASALGR